MMKTQGSTMEFTERNRRALRSASSLKSAAKAPMYARICQKNEEIGKIEGRCPYRGKAESKKIPMRAAKEVLTPRYPYASNQHVLWVADPETGTWGWILAQGEHVPIRARRLELKIRSRGLGVVSWSKWSIQPPQAAAVGVAVPPRLGAPQLCCPPTLLRWVSDQASIG